MMTIQSQNKPNGTRRTDIETALTTHQGIYGVASNTCSSGNCTT